LHAFPEMQHQVKGQQGYDHPRAACQQIVDSTSGVAVSPLFKEDILPSKGALIRALVSSLQS
jgi:hypothetical protein